MASGDQKTGADFYAVLGLSKECSDADLRNAYKKLAMRWHPDRCSATGNSKFVKEAKEKFQAIPEAYSVLSDTNKRFLYDVGAYDSDDDENGMGEFLGEMAQMMSQTKPNENGHESFQELQRLFVDMFQSDLDGGGLGWSGTLDKTDGYDRSSAASSSSSSSSQPSSSQPLCNGNNKRDSSAMGSVKAGTGDSGSGAFCLGIPPLQAASATVVSRAWDSGLPTLRDLGYQQQQRGCRRSHLCQQQHRRRFADRDWVKDILSKKFIANL